jgi:oligoribonuclease NrnB/cAMP/cGMP phosphodiesterase (DHH superfamily)
MKYDIYFHNDFDGRASAAVMLAFLRSRGDDIEHYVPVKYDIIPQWIKEDFFAKHKLFKGKRNPSIIVDFPYHPKAAFWFDHHVRPFRAEGWEEKFKPDASHRFVPEYRSACHLVYDSLKEGFGWKPPAHLKDLVKWLDVIDFANYKSAKQTIDMKEAALQANAFIEHTSDDVMTAIWTVKFLAEKSLAEFAATPRVSKKVAALKKNMARSLSFQKEHIIIEGRVMIIDLTGDPTDDLAYFGPYYLYPKMLYLVRFHPFPGKPSLFHINVGSSPWRRAENKKNIGTMLKEYGGGGHEYVGGVEILGKQKTVTVVSEIAAFLNKK